MYQDILNKAKPNLEKLVSDFRGQIAEIRTGRVAPSLVENISVDCFGSRFPLKQLGAVTATGKELVINLWDKSYAEAVIKAVEERKMNLGIKSDGRTIYLSAPPLTEESKNNLVKVLSEKKEEIFQEIRKLRDKIWKEIQEAEKENEITEDEKFKGKEKMEEMIKDYRGQIEEMVKQKETDIKS